EPGMLYVERQFGILELHDDDVGRLKRAGQAVLDGMGASADDQLKPRVLYTDIVDSVTDQHAVLLNRSREASMMLPGESLLLVELTPALFAGVAANEAERAAPDATLVDCQMIGASGRLFLSGTRADLEKARAGILEVLGKIEGRV
ncbi:MAG: microcompartment protein, partial [Pseudomonadota bacterium]|nr:microcompartment protein [Pseudomonadota bacterium]